jgi:hypothetical protein
MPSFPAAAVAHGKLRYLQGYTPAMLVESRILEVTVFAGTCTARCSSLSGTTFSSLLCFARASQPSTIPPTHRRSIAITLSVPNCVLDLIPSLFNIVELRERSILHLCRRTTSNWPGKSRKSTARQLRRFQRGTTTLPILYNIPAVNLKGANNGKSEQCAPAASRWA